MSPQLTNPYPRGALYLADTTGPWHLRGDDTDAVFTTHVTVPEPAALALLTLLLLPRTRTRSHTP